MIIHKSVNNNIHGNVNGQQKICRFSSEMDKVHKIKEIKHFRLLSDPLKLKLLQTLAEEQTVRQIAERHGGSIRCEGREGGGTRFVLELPAR